VLISIGCKVQEERADTARLKNSREVRNREHDLFEMKKSQSNDWLLNWCPVQDSNLRPSA
jgi:hypothetical protein